MIDENGAVSPPLTAIDIAVRTGTDGRVEADAYRHCIELAATYPEIDPESLVATLSGTVESDIGSTTMVVEIQRAARQGWVGLPYHSPKFQGLNKLVAWALSAGHVAPDYVPSFEIRHGSDYERLDRAFDRLGCEYEPVDESPRRVRPTEMATTVGRILVTLGVPVGEPNVRTTLPEYLSDCPDSLRREFAYTYLNNRTRSADSYPPACEQRSPSFRRELAAFLTHVTGESIPIIDDELVLRSEITSRLHRGIETNTPSSTE